MVLELESWDSQGKALKAWWRVFSSWAFLGFEVLASQSGEGDRDLKIFIVTFFFFFFLSLSFSNQYPMCVALQLDNQKRNVTNFLPSVCFNLLILVFNNSLNSDF